jgi:hypothetical protein
MKLARVKKAEDIHQEVETHSHLISDVEKREKLLENVKERNIIKQAVKLEQRAKRGTIRI